MNPPSRRDTPQRSLKAAAALGVRGRCTIAAVLMACGPSAGASMEATSGQEESSAGVTTGAGVDSAGSTTGPQDVTSGTSTSQPGSSEASTSEPPPCSETTGGSTDRCDECGLLPDWEMQAVVSQIVGSQLRMSYAGPQFELPSSILEHAGEPDHFFLSAEELEVVAEGAGEWNVEYGSIVNGLLEFSRCGAHAGNATWPDGNTWHVLYLRAYVLPESLGELEARVVCDAPDLVAGQQARLVGVELDTISGWRRMRIRYDVFYGDYGGIANVDIFAKDYCQGTVAIVFMYPDELPVSPQEDIESAVSSTCIAFPGEESCCGQ